MVMTLLHAHRQHSSLFFRHFFSSFFPNISLFLMVCALPVACLYTCVCARALGRVFYILAIERVLMSPWYAHTRWKFPNAVCLITCSFQSTRTIPFPFYCYTCNFCYFFFSVWWWYKREHQTIKATAERSSSNITKWWCIAWHFVHIE